MQSVVLYTYSVLISIIYCVQTKNIHCVQLHVFEVVVALIFKNIIKLSVSIDADRVNFFALLYMKIDRKRLNVAKDVSAVLLNNSINQKAYMLNIVCRKVRHTFNTAHVQGPDTVVTGYWARVI